MGHLARGWLGGVSIPPARRAGTGARLGRASGHRPSSRERPMTGATSVDGVQLECHQEHGRASVGQLFDARTVRCDRTVSPYDKGIDCDRHFLELQFVPSVTLCDRIARAETDVVGYRSLWSVSPHLLCRGTPVLDNLTAAWRPRTAACSRRTPTAFERGGGATSPSEARPLASAGNGPGPHTSRGPRGYTGRRDGIDSRGGGRQDRAVRLPGRRGRRGGRQLHCIFTEVNGS